MVTTAWWRGGTLYHAYVRSFRDTNGDGFGDIRGLIDKLDYLEWLGIDGLWLSPTMPSPNRDWGYDVSDYCDVQSDLGTLNDLDELISLGRERNIRIMLDLVANHTSDQHPWFVESRASKDSEYRDYYVWADAKPDGSRPNNWIDDTGEPGWTWDEATEQYYFHNFLDAQPDLNWWNPRVHEEFDRIVRFWFDRGVAGFRIDVANGLYKDAQLRDNPHHPRAYIYDTEIQGRYGLQHVHNFNQPEVHDVYRHWRAIAEEHPEPKLLLGETWVARVDELAPYYGEAGEELQLGFNFPFIFAPFEPEFLARIVRESLASFPPGSCPIWAGSNHDLPRMGTRWADGDVRKIRLAHTLLATLPGTFTIYYGDELGMVDSDIPAELQQDPLTQGGLNGQWPRDNARAPMRWDDSASGEFSSGTAWLPVPDETSPSVASQLRENDSVLHLVRGLIHLRRDVFAGTVPAYVEGPVSSTLWSFASGRLAVMANFSDEPVTLSRPIDPLLRSSTGAAGGLTDHVAPWEAVVFTAPTESIESLLGW
ncbi:alpha-amylase family glycosyl hydrolase [Plantibacter sp. Mn2098]|uniref:alpha-amylase family glycosyl hydrolase n=1 Tax=Plantibacter sp. Mn2098 TaxID=3395266 RepID=UPI003BC11E57